MFGQKRRIDLQLPFSKKVKIGRQSAKKLDDGTSAPAYFPGLSSDSHWRWTENEDRILVALRQEKMGFEMMHRYLTHRSCKVRWDHYLEFLS